MKVTNYMIFKWSKAVLLIIFGIIFLLYMDPVNLEIRNLFGSIPGAPQIGSLFDLSYAVYFVIAIWCFVDAALNILASFREQKMTLDDLAAKLDVIEMKLAQAKPVQPHLQPEIQPKPMIIEQENIGATEPAEVFAPAPPTDVPPPP